VLRVTADTNVIISALNFSGNPRHVLEMAEDGAIHLAVSDAILDEVERVLRRDKFGWPDEEFSSVGATGFRPRNTSGNLCSR